MAHLGTLHNFAFDRGVDDVRGTAVYGSNDEKLGKVDDVIFDHVTGDIRYVVIDTGGWLRSKKFLVPANHIHGCDKEGDAFQVDMAKNRIEQFPRYDETLLGSDQDWKDYEDKYKRAWEVDPVQHREDRVDLDVTSATISADITPTGVPRGTRAEIGSDVPRGSLGEELSDEYLSSEEEPAGRDDERLRNESIEDEDFPPRRLAGELPETAQSSDKIPMTPANVPEVGTGETMRKDVNRGEAHRAGVGQWHPRMKRFETVLRRNRVDLTASCPACAPKQDKAA